jgi:hypothetical protein
MSAERSSFYNSYLGVSKNKFSYTNEKSKPIGEQDFFKWTSNNMYRTSYHDMAKKVNILENTNLLFLIFKIKVLIFLLRFLGTICWKKKYGSSRISRIRTKCKG